jgi:hypothetical protein
MDTNIIRARLKRSVVDRMPDLSLRSYATTIHSTAVLKGWWSADRNVGEVIANIHSEVSEAWKEWVHNHGVNETYYTMDSSKIPFGGEDHVAISTMVAKWSRFQWYLKTDGTEYAQTPPEPTKVEVEKLVTLGILEPHGFPTELADIIIRCLDLFDAYGLDADEVVLEKMRYNLTRAQRHGGKRA